MIEPERKRYNVGAVKIPFADRDVAHAALADGNREFLDIIGADTPDDDDRFPVGSDVTYGLELTAEEAERFAAASNLRYIEEDVIAYPARAVGRPTGTSPNIPSLATLAWMRSRYVDLRRWNGRDVPVAILDQGTTQAVRNVMGYTLVARTTTGGVSIPPGQELLSTDQSHGCLVAPNAVPAGGRLLDCIITDGTGAAGSGSIAAGIRWAVDNGGKVINCSFAVPPGTPTQANQDACAYARDNGNVQVVFSAGNDNLPDISAIAAISRLPGFANVHSSIAFDESTDRRGMFSSYSADASGCGPGVDVNSLDISGDLVRWNGTSASSPHMAQLIARGATGGTFTVGQVGAALKANTRATGAPAAEQGGGAYDLHRALVALGALPATAPAAGVAPVTHISTQGAAVTTSSYTFFSAAGAQPDDVQIIILVASVGAQLVRPAQAQILGEFRYHAGYELQAGQAVGPTAAWVLALPYVAGQPSQLPVSFATATWFSALSVLTLRGVGGLDPERFAPQVRFGTGNTLSSLPVVPATTNDLLVCAFAQRHPAASTGTLTLPSGLTQRGFYRPTSGTTGYTLLVGSAQLTGGARTGAFSSISNDNTGTWCSIAFTVPAGAPAVAPVVQSEPPSDPGAFLPFLPRS